MYRLREEDNSRIAVEKAFFGSVDAKVNGIIWVGYWVTCHVAVYGCIKYILKDPDWHIFWKMAFYLLCGVVVFAYLFVADMLFGRKETVLDPKEGVVKLERRLLGLPYYRVRQPLEPGRAKFDITVFEVGFPKPPVYNVWYLSPADKDIKMAEIIKPERALEMFEQLHEAFGPDKDIDEVIAERDAERDAEGA